MLLDQEVFFCSFAIFWDNCYHKHCIQSKPLLHIKAIFFTNKIQKLNTLTQLYTDLTTTTIYFCCFVLCSERSNMLKGSTFVSIRTYVCVYIYHKRFTLHWTDKSIQSYRMYCKQFVLQLSCPGKWTIMTVPVVSRPKGYFRAIYHDMYYCLLYTSPSPRDRQKSRMPSSA